MQKLVSHRKFAKKVQETYSSKGVNPITKLQHVKLDLAALMQPNMLPLLKQNVINRKASSYANVDLVYNHYQKHRSLLKELE